MELSNSFELFQTLELLQTLLNSLNYTYMKYIYIISGIIFLLCAAVQYNDPDPGVWMAIYGVAAIVSFQGVRHYLPSWTYLVLFLIFTAGAVSQWPPHFEGLFFNELATMRNMNIEEARESLGLGICAFAMLLFYLLERRR